jgi:hypothetical protein
MGILLAIVGVGAALAAVTGLMSAVRRDPFAERMERISEERSLGVPTPTASVGTGVVHDEAWALLAAAKKPTDQAAPRPAPRPLPDPALGVVGAPDPVPTSADSL